MRTLKLIVIAMAVVVAVTSMGIILAKKDTRVAPVLECSVPDDQAIEVTVEEGVQDIELLKFVTAYDEQDGDLTDKIIVVREKYFIDQKTSIVTFTVCDSDNNVDMIKKKIVYTDYKKPEFQLKHDFIFRSGQSISTKLLQSYVTAIDVFDTTNSTDISKYIKIISSELTNIEGKYDINIKVSNSMGDSEVITFKAEVVSDLNTAHKIELNNYLIYYEEGMGDVTNPDFWKTDEYIDSITGKTYTVDDIVVDTTGIDLTKPGVNYIKMSIYDEIDGVRQEITYTRVMLVVRED